MNSRVFALLSFLALLILPSEGATTALIFGGHGWVNQDRNWYVSQETGYTITSQVTGYQGAVAFSCSSSTDWWYVAFAAPEGQSLQVGTYNGAIRFPFNEGSQPGMDIYGDGRGSNQVSATFQVLEISWNTDGTLQSFAADFTHLSEFNPNAMTVGAIRYNSAIAIPEASSLTLGLIPLLGLVRRRR